MLKSSGMSYAGLSTDFAFHELGFYSLLLKFVLGRTKKPLSLGTKTDQQPAIRELLHFWCGQKELVKFNRNSEIVAVTNPTQFIDLGFRRMIFLLKFIVLNAR